MLVASYGRAKTANLNMRKCVGSSAPTLFLHRISSSVAVSAAIVVAKPLASSCRRGDGRGGV